MNSTKVKVFLGVPYASAMYKLRKMLLFELAIKSGRDVCYRCGGKITNYADLTIDHKKSWLGVNVDLFWDLDNVAFSHHSCNSKRKDYHPSEETKEKLRSIVRTEEFKRRVSQGMMGHRLSEETKRKIGLANSKHR